MMNFLMKCFCLPEAIALVMAGGVFVLAYVLYHTILLFLKQLAKKRDFWKILAKRIRLPLLWLLLEIAAIISIYIFNLPEKSLRIAKDVLHVCIIATLGWFAISALSSYYRYYTHKMGDSEQADPAHRLLFTQILFLYRFLVFIFCAITIATIFFIFPNAKSVGIGILGSAGIAGIAIGIAARPVLLNLIAGFQLALTKTIRIGDTLFMEGDSVRVESIHLTHIILRTWDLRRIIVPISYFIDRPFQNWDTHNSELQCSVLIYCDYSLPVDSVRNKMKTLIELSPHWNKKAWNICVTNCTEQTMEIRASASADNASAASELRTFLREKLIEFIQNEYPDSLPCIRSYQFLSGHPNRERGVAE